MAFVAALAVIAATGQGVPAFAAAPSPARAASIAAEQSSVALAGQALGLGRRYVGARFLLRAGASLAQSRGLPSRALLGSAYMW